MEEQKEIEVNIAEYCVTQGADFKFWSDFLTDEQIIRWSQADSSSDFSVVDYIKILNRQWSILYKFLIFKIFKTNFFF